MAGSDAITVGNDWISEHYFTTDATTQSFQAKVSARRKAWDTERDTAVPTDTIRTRFGESRSWLLDTLAGLAANGTDDNPILADPGGVVPELSRRLKEVLGYTAAIGLKTETIGPVTWVTAPGMTAGAPLILLDARPVTAVEALLAKDADTLAEPHVLGDGTEVRSAARALSALFVADDAPDYALVLAGRFLLVAERARWAEGRYLAVDLQLVCERNDDRRGGEVDRALACVGAESLAPDADGAIWWTGVLEDSVKHTVGVSADLREGVRLSIEIIANEVLRRRAAAGLETLPPAEAKPLGTQALRFLYRILFLLYAEASPQFGVLPVGSVSYDRGYSLDRLRDLTLVELADPRSREGTHLYDSLHTLFRLVDRSTDDAAAAGQAPEGLQFRSLRADLFRPAAVAHIEEVKLGNAALQQVLRHLLLSKEARGKDRGFISYAELGINQLGAVYEGLMSYTGFFATEDLFEVAKGGDASKGSWVVPTHRADGLDPADFVRVKDPATGESQPVVHRAGNFVFRLAGRERQQSASYYTPEVLTRFVVSQALAELLDQDGARTPAADILKLTICEPALGSGAFAIEAVRQLAAQYLTRRQEELGERIDPDDYPRLLQEVKASIALHQVYGVDLNATAVELAEISLWLDTMVEGLDAPWFGLHLRRGNSLIGARRAVFTRDAVAKKTWYSDLPTDASLTGLMADDGPDSAVDGRVHHFLLPATGWGSACEAKEAKDLAPDALARLKDWRKTFGAKPTAKQVDALVDLARRAETLWRHALRRLTVAEHEIRRAIPVWGSEPVAGTGSVQRDQIEFALADVDGAYQRLRRVMDSWRALWFWPLTDQLTTQEVDGQRERILPPSLDAWIDALQKLMGRHQVGRKPAAPGQLGLDSAGAWEALADAEAADLAFAGAVTVAEALAAHPWLLVCERVATQQGFFHWDLDFASVFACRGFDLQLGNPPWVRPDIDVDGLLAEGDPWWSLAVKASESLRVGKREETLALPGMTDFLMDGLADTVAVAAAISDPQIYPRLAGLRPDLYRCFMAQAWRHMCRTGAVGLIHLESHFTDEKAGPFREANYQRLRRHWHFVNEGAMFDIGNQKNFGVNIYGCPLSGPAFLSANWLYHPDTVERSLMHDGSGPEPGLKDDEGRFDLRPHSRRITRVVTETLRTWHDALESPDVPLLYTRAVYAVNHSTASVLDKLARSPRLGSLGPRFCLGWDEKKYRTLGFFESSWSTPDTWDDAILQGPHLFVATPLYKAPNKTMLNNKDWAYTDFEALPADAKPVTAYTPLGDRYRYDCAYTDWGTAEHATPARDHYRLAWRTMAAPTGERTLMAAIIPPGPVHVDGVFSVGFPESPLRTLVICAGFASALVADLGVRTTGRKHIRRTLAGRIPVDSGFPLNDELALRVLRLNCVTSIYSGLWNECYEPKFAEASWAGVDPLLENFRLGSAEDAWSPTTPLRLAYHRRQAQLEIDSLVAIALGLSADELCSVYRTQFSVLFGYDSGISRTRQYFYDVHGRLVPGEVLKAWKAKGGRITAAERTATNAAGNTYVYEPQFRTLDREADMRQAYAHFERVLKERS
jgi:hypothetical protein